MIYIIIGGAILTYVLIFATKIAVESIYHISKVMTLISLSIIFSISFYKDPKRTLDSIEEAFIAVGHFIIEIISLFF